MASHDKQGSWVSAQKIASMFGVSRDTILRLARRGLIPSVRVGGQRRFDLTVVEKVFEREGGKEVEKD